MVLKLQWKLSCKFHTCKCLKDTFFSAFKANLEKKKSEGSDLYVSVLPRTFFENIQNVDIISKPRPLNEMTVVGFAGMVSVLLFGTTAHFHLDAPRLP